MSRRRLHDCAPPPLASLRLAVRRLSGYPWVTGRGQSRRGMSQRGITPRPEYRRRDLRDNRVADRLQAVPSMSSQSAG